MGRGTPLQSQTTRDPQTTRGFVDCGSCRCVPEVGWVPLAGGVLLYIHYTNSLPLKGVGCAKIRRKMLQRLVVFFVAG